MPCASRRSLLAALLLAGAGPALAAPPKGAGGAAPSAAVANAWWRHVQFLADDSLQGRDTGSEGYAKAAAYVVEQLKAAGVRPGAGGDSYLQPVALQSRRLDESRSRLALVRDGQEHPVTLGKEAVLTSRTGEPGKVEAPLVFVGYGLTIPEAGYDDLKGVDLKGKVAVLLYGGPGTVSGPLRAHHASSSERYNALKAAGAVGVLMLQNPKQMEVPWSRVAGARKMPAMMFEDAALNDPSLQLGGAFDPAAAELLFEGSGHSFQEVLALADADKPLPHFPLPTRVRAELAFDTAPVQAHNVVGVLPGSDPALAQEYVVLSAHLDHVGVGEPVKGDRIYNGAMDNASGVAAVLEVARALHAQGTAPKRSVLFLLVTGEEKGLMGSKFFAAHPTVPKGALVADLNLDMFLPLFPLTHLTAYGADESTLAEPLKRIAEARGVKLTPDPEPNRMAFVRSDQYSFIRAGIPALAFKFGFEKGSAQERLQKRWYRERYHGPADDLSQPVSKEGAAKFVGLLAELTRAVADAPERPQWNAQSFFARFAQAPAGSSSGAAAPAAH
ncbi:M20/M25/M40 family metallo-hydrolase [Aggregicoccus sp. 17bor-14]|uniref:M28 family metallopeptidase n=1 Tax=Myxococcaceae TaxID=31 RepID=UPI00129D1142|nr:MULTISPECIES: M28 family metallopeptidase [Myxococcaceae]MBF5045011.1 M20/M25/M40 family metallo-hydrolase [Simulacricoccus sp. 17bor-14]MRI90754.1 M20/M25/M40 family metallo-hydrolase [Aggregicoccus sp. 17bor-14]